eukprot:RCo003499
MLVAQSTDEALWSAGCFFVLNLLRDGRASCRGVGGKLCGSSRAASSRLGRCSPRVSFYCFFFARHKPTSGLRDLFPFCGMGSILAYPSSRFQVVITLSFSAFVLFPRAAKSGVSVLFRRLPTDPLSHSHFFFDLVNSWQSSKVSFKRDNILSWKDLGLGGSVCLPQKK